MKQDAWLDNSALLPPLQPDSAVTLEDSGNGLQSPDWVKSLIIEQANVLSASPDGTFAGMGPVLDHFAEVGVNCVWLNPIQDGRHYYNYGPATVNPLMTGTDDYAEGWRRVKAFVDEAHRRNIRVLLDIVTWGIHPDAPIFKEHPDWFDGYSEQYKGPLYNWKNSELLAWFSDQLVRMIRETGADGFRADGGIQFCGPELYAGVRRRLHAEGRYVAMIGECIDEGTESFFDFNEHSIDYWTRREGEKFFDGEINFVSGYKPDMIAAVKRGYGLDTRTRQAAGEAGKLRFYSSIGSCHDSLRYTVGGRLVRIAYTSLLSPFIPMWYIGEEWNNPQTIEEGHWMYANRIDWSTVGQDRAFYEAVKRVIRIRRLLPELFTYFPLCHREINFCPVETVDAGHLPAYARPGQGYGVVVIPNGTDAERRTAFVPPLAACGIAAGADYRLTDLLSGEELTPGETVACRIPSQGVGVYALRGVENGTDPLEAVLKQL